ncbi:hypothetical protein PIB30_079313, partial [Stylosanthes scabra]|nr:hypothetical protein [Stylosanthes scabra]
MALNGRNPVIAIWGMVLLYQGRGGISRGYLVVRTGAWNSALLFFPAIPPKTSNGDVTNPLTQTHYSLPVSLPRYNEDERQAPISVVVTVSAVTDPLATRLCRVGFRLVSASPLRALFVEAVSGAASFPLFSLLLQERSSQLCLCLAFAPLH